jgi:hypothetical protein
MAHPLDWYRTVGTVTPTRFADLYVWHQAPGLWRFLGVYDDDGNASETGPHMRTKVEAMGLVGQFARDMGYAD